MKLKELLEVCEDHQEFEISGNYIAKKYLVDSLLSESEISSIRIDRDTTIYLKFNK